MITVDFHFDDLQLAARTDESFDDLIARNHYRSGPLVALDELRLDLADN